ncbi:MAG TPA: alpha/beta fold hydrolase, partial [Pilimelia sp.]|nr:alpha/beta fold hydrolase [Pilimelia sp.]
AAVWAEVLGIDPDTIAAGDDFFERGGNSLSAMRVVAGQPRGRVVLWGHCVGSAIAIEVARLLTAQGHPPAHLFIGAKLLYAPDALRESIAYVAGMSYEDITHWLTVETGFTGFDELGPGYADLLVRTFRHDSVSANEYYLAGAEPGAAPPLAVPTTAVFADDDPVTVGYRDSYQDWKLFAAGVQLREVGGGGHYFTRTRPAKVAELVGEALGDE